MTLGGPDLWRPQRPHFVMLRGRTPDGRVVGAPMPCLACQVDRFAVRAYHAARARCWPYRVGQTNFANRPVRLGTVTRR